MTLRTLGARRVDSEVPLTIMHEPKQRGFGKAPRRHLRFMCVLPNVHMQVQRLARAPRFVTGELQQHGAPGAFDNTSARKALAIHDLAQDAPTEPVNTRGNYSFRCTPRGPPQTACNNKLRIAL